MTLSQSRWHVIAESNFAWEREALDWLRSHLPDRDPWHAWTNFEFIDDEGKVSEVDAQQARAIARGLNEAGIRPSNKHRQVGDYKLGRLLSEGEGFQDWEAQHVSIETVHRRVRIYTVATASNPEARATRVRQARREFEVLEGIDHPGILKVKDYKETEMGPALVFDHDPKAIRLDHLLRDHGTRLTVTQRLQLVRDIAETLKYAHSKRLYHRALGPQSILVQNVEGGNFQLRLDRKASCRERV